MFMRRTAIPVWISMCWSRFAAGLTDANHHQARCWRTRRRRSEDSLFIEKVLAEAMPAGDKDRAILAGAPA